MLSERGGSWPCESKHPYAIQERRGGNRGPSTRGKGGRSLRVTLIAYCRTFHTIWRNMPNKTSASAASRLSRRTNRRTLSSVAAAASG